MNNLNYVQDALNKLLQAFNILSACAFYSRLVVDISRFANSQKMLELCSKDLVDAFKITKVI